MAKYDFNNITETLRLDRGMRHLCVDFRQQASLILYRQHDKTMDDKTLVSEFGAKLFVLVCVWRLLCDYGGLTGRIRSKVSTMVALFGTQLSTTKDFRRTNNTCRPKNNS